MHDVGCQDDICVYAVSDEQNPTIPALESFKPVTLKMASDYDIAKRAEDDCAAWGKRPNVMNTTRLMHMNAPSTSIYHLCEK